MLTLASDCHLAQVTGNLPVSLVSVILGASLAIPDEISEFPVVSFFHFTDQQCSLVGFFPVTYPRFSIVWSK